MSNGPAEPRSRRAILAAAAGGAAALAASAALPLTAAAAPVNMQTELDNPTILETSITQATASGAIVAFRVKNTTRGAASVIGSSGSETNIAPDTSYTGVYGWAETGTADIGATGIWGDSDDYGAVGTGGYGGVVGLGNAGVTGLGGVDGVVGLGGATGAGVLAIGDTPTAVALDVRGKLKLSRSGRSSIGAGKSSLRVNLAGVTTSSRIFAVMYTNRTGRWVRAVAPSTNYFTIYLNTTVTSNSYISWFVVN